MARLRYVIAVLGLTPCAVAPTAAAAGFGPPSTFAPSQEGAPSAVGVNDAGTIAAAWVEDPGLTFARDPRAVRVVVRRPDGRRSGYVGVGRVGVTQVAGVFVDAAGTATIVYVQDATGVSVARCTVRGCAPPRVLDARGALASAAADDTGRVLVMWRGETGRGPRLKLALVGGRSLRRQTLGETGGQPAVAVAGGRFLAAWAIPGAVRTAVLRSNGTMSRPRTVFDDVFDRSMPVDLAAAGTARGVVVGWHATRSADEVQTVDLDRDGRRTRYQAIGMSRGRLAVSAAANGRVLLTTGFEQPGGACGGEIHISLREPRATRFPAPATPLSAGTRACSYDAAMDAAGRATVAWHGDQTPVAALTGVRGGLGAASALGGPSAPSACCGGRGPLLAVGGNRTVAVWDAGPTVQFATRTG